MSTVTLASKRPALRVVALLNEPGVVRRPPAPGWEEIARPRRPAVIVWRGSGLPRLDFTVMLDGYGAKRSQEPFIRNLERMASPVSEGLPPPAVSASGPFSAAAGFSWVIEELVEVEPVIRDPAGQRLRQGYTFTLARYVEADLIVTKTPAARVRERQAAARRTDGPSAGRERAPNPRAYVVRQGDTLTSIAARELRNPSRAAAIGDENNLPDLDDIRVGQRLKLP